MTTINDKLTFDGTNDIEKIASQRWLAYYTEDFHAWAVFYFIRAHL